MGSFDTRLAGVVLCAGMLMSAGCSEGSSDVLPLPPETDTAAEATTSTTTPTTTSATSTTVTESTTATTPSGKPILDIPTEWDSDLDEIIGRYLLYWEAFDIATAPPETDVDYPPLAELMSPESYEELRGQLQEKFEAGEVNVVEGTVTEHRTRLPNPSVLTRIEGNEVVLQDCFIDGRIVQTTDGEIINDDVYGTLLNVKMKVIEGQWRVYGVANATDESSGYQECRDYGEQLNS